MILWLVSDFKLATMAGKREEKERGSHQGEFHLDDTGELMFL